MCTAIPTRTVLLTAAAFSLGLSSPLSAAAPTEPFPVVMHVDAGQMRGELRPIWRFFGADEPNYA